MPFGYTLPTPAQIATTINSNGGNVTEQYISDNLIIHNTQNMGLFSDIGGFISQNIQSAVNDVSHVVQQVAPLAVGALNLAIPGAGTVASALLGAGHSTPTTSVDNSANDAIQQLSANQQTLVAQNQQLAQQIANQNANVSTPTSKTFIQTLQESFKKYWYFYVIPIIGIPIGLYFAFKPKKRRR